MIHQNDVFGVIHDWYYFIANPYTNQQKVDGRGKNSYVDMTMGGELETHKPNLGPTKTMVKKCIGQEF